MIERSPGRGAGGGFRPSDEPKWCMPPPPIVRSMKEVGGFSHAQVEAADLAFAEFQDGPVTTN